MFQYDEKVKEPLISKEKLLGIIENIPDKKKKKLYQIVKACAKFLE